MNGVNERRLLFMLRCTIMRNHRATFLKFHRMQGNNECFTRIMNWPMRP